MKHSTVCFWLLVALFAFELILRHPNHASTFLAGVLVVGALQPRVKP